MRNLIKKHLREIIWFSFLNRTDIFLSHELLEMLCICYKQEKAAINKESLKFILRKIIFNSIENNEEGRIKWIGPNNKKFKILLKNDLMFLKNREHNLIKKWFLISFKHLISASRGLCFKEEDIDLYDIIMEIDGEYKEMLLNCIHKKLCLEDEVSSVLNVNSSDIYFDDTTSLKNSSVYGSRFLDNESEGWEDDWDEDEVIYENLENINIDNSDKKKGLLSIESNNQLVSNKLRETDLHIYASTDTLCETSSNLSLSQALKNELRLRSTNINK